MISAEAPVLFAKACELFISDLTIRSYAYTAEDKGKRRTLTREDVCLAVQQTDVYDFLVGVLMPSELCWLVKGAKTLFFFLCVRALLTRPCPPFLFFPLPPSFLKTKSPST